MQSATLERPATDAQQKSQHHPTPMDVKKIIDARQARAREQRRATIQINRAWAEHELFKTVISAEPLISEKPCAKRRDNKKTAPRIKTYLTKKQHQQLKAGIVPKDVANWDLITFGRGQAKLLEKARRREASIVTKRDRVALREARMQAAKKPVEISYRKRSRVRTMLAIAV